MVEAVWLFLNTLQVIELKELRGYRMKRAFVVKGIGIVTVYMAILTGRSLQKP